MNLHRLLRVISVSILLIVTWPLSAARIDALTWLADCWAYEGAEAGSGETWTPAAGGTMFGISRTVAEGRTVMFEFMQIRTADDGTPVFIAQPNGGAPVEFPATEVGDAHVVFSNPANDYPQQVRYERRDGGMLYARIEGGGPAIDFPMHRVACGARELTAAP